MVRLIFSILFLLLGLMCVFPAPESHLWYLSIIVTEFSWLFILGCALLLLWGRWVKKRRRAGSYIAASAMLLYLIPIVTACFIAASLNASLEKALGCDPTKEQGSMAPFSVLRMFTGLNRRLMQPVMLGYSVTKTGMLTLDYYPAGGGGIKPCVVVIHGGSWCSGDSRQLPDLNTHLANLGYNVASINYRLAPQYRFPAPTEDVRAAIQYLKSYGASGRIDTNCFVLLGRSAGGQIALDAAYTLNDPSIKGVVDIYGPADMAWGYAHPANPLVLDTRGIMTAYLGGSPASVPEAYAASSAITTVTRSSPPTLMIHGRNDPLVPYGNSKRLNELLDSLGVRHFYLDLPWATHGCDYSLNGPSGQLSTYTIERFLQFVTR